MTADRDREPVPIGRYALVALLAVLVLLGVTLLVRPLIFSLADPLDDARYRLLSVSDADKGPRLVEIAEAAAGIEGRSAVEVFGSPDDMKLRSCATLFAKVSPAGSVFERLLARYFGGEPDDETLRLLGQQSA